MKTIFQLLSKSWIAEQEAAYISYHERSAGGADFYSFVQLWNPSGSGKNLNVEKLIIVLENSELGYFQLGDCNTAIDTADYGHKNKFLGGASGVAKIYNAILEAASFPAGYARTRYPATVGDGASKIKDDYFFKPNIVVPPGHGLTVQNTEKNAFLQVGFEWYEVNA